MNQDSEEKKKILRAKVLGLRKEISQSDLEIRNRQIEEHLLSSELVRRATTIHCFVSMKDKVEVETRESIRGFLNQNKTVVVPVIEDNLHLRHSRIDSLDSLMTNSWGVSEPKKVQEVDLETIDLILVPALAVDLQGNRLGYGKGFYDRFLAGMAIPKIGLCFEEFVYQEIPFEKHDIKLDGIISEKGVRLL